MARSSRQLPNRHSPTPEDDSLRILLTLTLSILWIGSAMAFLAQSDLATRFRNDIRPGGLPTDGRHEIWQFNILDPRNYSSEGRAAYGRLLATFLVMLLSAAGCIYLLVGFLAGGT